MYEYPPILKGTEQQQLTALRDYLVRMARSLQAAEEAAREATAGAASLPAAVQEEAPGSSAQNPITGQDAQAARLRAGELRALILKTASRLDGQIGAVQQNVDRVNASLREDYLAVSDFGVYAEQAALNMSATAREVVESFDFRERIDAVGASLDALDSYMTSIRGEIRRGLITDPETGEAAMGIAISENLSFTGQVHVEDGVTYYELSPGQTLGLYTATGWQFWINGSKRGWFDSQDSMLHVTRLRAVDSIDLGDSWRLSSAGGLGIKYTGG